MNLLLISIDSLRLDFVSRTSTQIHTPRFDALTRDFAFSERCFSVSSATRPVHASLFTGLYPFEHGLLGQDYPLMRSGIPHLFELFHQRNWAIGGFSEARKIFAGLPFSSWMESLDLAAETGTRQVGQFLNRHREVSCFLFLHYWSAHTPYGAADRRAFGEIGQLLARGQRRIVVDRYARAVEAVFENKLAPLLSGLDLQEWCVFITSDHGESWTPHEPYHGQTLRNSVLRVPLFFHIPRTGNPPSPRPLLSLVDLFPTLAALCDLPVDYRGFGRDIRQEPGPDYYLAQIHPVPGHDDLAQARQKELYIETNRPGRQWALFDSRRKFTYDEDYQMNRLENTWSEEALDDEQAVAHFVEAYQTMQAQSTYARFPLEEATQAQEDLLARRLRDLGYLD